MHVTSTSRTDKAAARAGSATATDAKSTTRPSGAKSRTSGAARAAGSDATARRSDVAAPSARSAGPTRQRRRPILVAVGAVLVLVAALASYVTFVNLSTSVTVVVTTTDISQGEVVDATSLGTLEIAGGQATNAIPALHAQQLVGQYAAGDMPAGSLVMTTSVQPSLPIDPGMSIVGIAVSTGQLPSSGLVNGDRVRLVSTPIAQGEPPIETPIAIEAVVFAARPDERTGGFVIDVSVANAVAADVAARAATGRIAIVLDSASGGA